MQRWLIGFGLLSLCAAADAQIRADAFHERSVPKKAPPLNLRLTQVYTSRPLPRIENGIIAEADVMPNARIGVGLVAVTSRRPGLNLRLEGKPDRSRKPAVTFVWKF